MRLLGRGASDVDGTIDVARRRLRISHLTAALMPCLLAAAPVYAVSQQAAMPIDLRLFGALMVAITLILGALLRWLDREVLKPAEAMYGAQDRYRRLYEAARDVALEDSLTALGNHRAFHEEIAQAIELALTEQQPISLIVLDIDNFKQVNDRNGHAAGDELLRRLSRMMTTSLRSADRAYRTGGDEFAILVNGADAEEARAAARRLLAYALEASEALAISFSAGVSSLPGLADSKAELLRQADAAMYRAKRLGRTTVAVFDPELDHTFLQTAGDAGELVSRVASDRTLRPVYQPIIEVKTGRVVGYEGLVRPTPESGFTNAGQLFVAAEGAGKTTELDLACIAVVAENGHRLGPDQYLAINISPRTLEAPEFNITWLLSTIEQAGMTPERVVLELTEREAIENVERLRRNLRACQQAGIRIAADDVGAGNAGLRLLSQVRFDVVKIDLTLVHEGSLMEPSTAVLRSLVDLASRWGATVVAEGVETSEHFEIVRELGVYAAQGYLIGYPDDLPESSVTDIRSVTTRMSLLRQMLGPSAA